jgi:twinkle protein
MSREQRDWAVEFCEEHFLFMDHSRQGPSTIEGILDVASKAVMRQGSRVLVIDPYNFIEMPSHEKETDAISRMLTTVQTWARVSDAHVFFIAHPTKISPDRRSEKKVVVTGHDIAGSAAWFAKADIGLSVWRHPQDLEPPEAIVWKCRWSWLGRHGSCQLGFDRVTGRWTDYLPEKADPTYWDGI